MPGLFFPEDPQYFFYEFPTPAAIRIGRAPENSIQLPDPQVSRLHATIENEKSQYRIHNLSRNGTRVNGLSIEKHSLSHGDKVQIGRFTMQFQMEHDSKSHAQLLAQQATQVPVEPVEPLEHDMVCASPIFQATLHRCRLAAPTLLPVLILGETGSGKEIIAAYLKGHSTRADKPLVTLNCANLSAGLIESEIFGHEEGAFTGAVKRRLGVFEAANGGTLFLDEIGDLPLELQPKILRILEEKKFRRLGSVQEIPMDVRVLAATNRDLEAEVSAGRFREDLFHRLNIFSIDVPPLRNRIDDIELLARFFLQKNGFSKIIATEALRALQSYSFPGNVRELRNLILRAALLSTGERIESSDLHFPKPPLTLKGAASLVTPTRSALENAESQMIRRHLESHNWNRQKTSQALGIARSTLFLKMQKYGIGMS